MWNPGWFASELCDLGELFLSLKYIFINDDDNDAQTVKNPPAMQGTWVQSLGWEDALEKEMATHSSILAWRFPWTEEPGGLQSMGSQRVRHDWTTKHGKTHDEFHLNNS